MGPGIHDIIYVYKHSEINTKVFKYVLYRKMLIQFPIQIVLMTYRVCVENHNGGMGLQLLLSDTNHRARLLCGDKLKLNNNSPIMILLKNYLITWITLSRNSMALGKLSITILKCLWQFTGDIITIFHNVFIVYFTYCSLFYFYHSHVFWGWGWGGGGQQYS